MGILETTPGVKDVIDEIDEAPTSPNDDRLRVALAPSIYGTSALQKYALDPQAPIRIVVENSSRRTLRCCHEQTGQAGGLYEGKLCPRCVQRERQHHGGLGSGSLNAEVPSRAPGPGPSR